jgi:hypothetical protein
MLPPHHASYPVAILRRLAVVVAAAFLVVSCSDCSAKCTQGITFLVADVAGSLARGTTEPLHICFDDQCQDVAISRANSGGTVFLPFSGVGKDTDHDLTVTGAGALKGEYKGKLASYVQKPNGNSCPSCALATVKIGADGVLTPGVPVAPKTTTTVGSVPAAGVTSTTTG